MKISRRTLLGFCAVLAAGIGAPAAAQEYTVAAELALTGTYAWVGVPSHEGLLVGLDEVNSSGMLGAAKIKLTVEDTGSEKGRAITLINRFQARDNVLMVLGPTSSGEGVAIAPVANDLKIPLLTTTAVSEAINKSGIWAFKTPASPSLIIGDVARYAVDKLHIKTAALVFGRDNDGQVGQKNACPAILQGPRRQDRRRESVLATDTDFSRAADEDHLAQPGSDLPGADRRAEPPASIIQARQGGIDPNVRFIGVPNMGAEQFITIGGKAVEGLGVRRRLFPRHADAGEPALCRRLQAQVQPRSRQRSRAGLYRDQDRSHRHQDGWPEPDPGKHSRRPHADQRTAGDPRQREFAFDENRGANYSGVILTIKNGKIVPAE